MPPILLNFMGMGLFGGLFGLILLPLELFRWFFRGYRYTRARIASWTMIVLTACAIVWTLNGAPITLPDQTANTQSISVTLSVVVARKAAPRSEAARATLPKRAR